MSMYWGPPTWKALHCICAGDATRQAKLAFINALGPALPCAECREHTLEYIESSTSITFEADTMYDIEFTALGDVANRSEEGGIEARKIATEQGRPVIMEAMTYRIGPHSTSDDDSGLLYAALICGIIGLLLGLAALIVVITEYYTGQSMPQQVYTMLQTLSIVE